MWIYIILFPTLICWKHWRRLGIEQIWTIFDSIKCRNNSRRRGGAYNGCDRLRTYRTGEGRGRVKICKKNCLQDAGHAAGVSSAESDRNGARWLSAWGKRSLIEMRCIPKLPVRVWVYALGLLELLGLGGLDVRVLVAGVDRLFGWKHCLIIINISYRLEIK